MLYQYSVFIEVDEDIGESRPMMRTNMFRELIEKAIQTHRESKPYRIGWSVDLVARTVISKD